MNSIFVDVKLILHKLRRNILKIKPKINHILLKIRSFLIILKLFLFGKISFKFLIQLTLGCDIAYYRLHSLKNTKYSKLLFEKSSCLIHAPRFIGHVQKRLINEIPDLNIFSFEGGIINSRSNAILTKNRLFVDTYCNDEIFNKGLIHSNNETTAKIKIKEIQIIPEGFFLAGLGSFNWYHWIVEILPKIFFFNESGSKTILVDESVANFKSMFDSLNIFLKKAHYSLFLLDKNRNYYVNKLYYVGAINYVPFNVIQNRALTLGDFFFRRDILNAMRNVYLQNIAPKETYKYNCKIYLNRKNHRVPKNHDEFILRLNEFGFEIVSLENLSFAQQLELFQNAKIILGITGAGFTNLLFANESASIYCISPDKDKEAACFSILAEIVGLEMTYLPYELQEGIHHYSNEFYVDIDGILDAIKIDKNYV